MRLQERGLNSVERKKLYTKEEVLMLSEIKALKKRGFKCFKNKLKLDDNDGGVSPPRSGDEYDYD